MSSPTHFPPLTPPPTAHTRRQQNSEMETTNSVLPIRRPVTPSDISDDYAPTPRASEVPASRLSARDSPTFLARRVALSSQTLDGSSNLSENLSTITLPSFVQQEQLNPTPSPAVAPRNPATAERVRSFPSSSRSSFPPSRSRSMVENTTPPTTPSFETSLRHGLPSPLMSVSDRLPHPHRTRPPLSRRAGVRYELATAKLKSAARAEVVKIVRPGSQTSVRSGTDSSSRNAPSRLVIPAHTLSFLGDYDYFPFGDRCPLRDGQDTGFVSNDLSQPTSPNPSRETWPVPEEPEGESPALYADDPTRPSSYQSPVLGFLNSPSSCTSPDEGRSRANSRATSSMSTIPSISAFPSPPGFTPAPRDKTLSILSYSTFGQRFQPTTSQEHAPVRGAETTSPNKGRASTRLSDAPRLMTTVNSGSVFSRHLRSELICRDDMSGRSRASPKISSLRRLSRVPLGPRQMCGGSNPPLRWTSQPPSP